jgi:tetratricopeptide (TPR) repeat protein
LAGEVLSAALLGGDTRLAREAAEYLRARKSEVSPIALSMAESILNAEGENDLHFVAATKGLTASIRRALRAYPYDPIGWCELSRVYAIQGQHKKSERAMRTAISLGKENRYILRSAARCFLHLDEAEQALRLLERSPRSKCDPWLTSAAISAATVSNRSPRLFRTAKSLASDSNLSTFHRAELCAALGTLEMEQGNDKKARRFLNEALQRPTENVVAQAWWAKTNQHLNIILPAELLQQSHSFEANTFALIRTDQWHHALTASEQWLKDEPFASRPAVETSFIKTVAFEEFDDAIKILGHSLRTNPGDPLVINNLAFSLANVGEFETARRILRLSDQAQKADSDSISLLATEGLICFREGNVMQGREHYKRAISLARKAKDERRLGIAMVFLAKEELRAKTDQAQMAKEAAREALKGKDDPHLKLVAQNLDNGPLKRENVSVDSGNERLAWAPSDAVPNRRIAMLAGPANLDRAPLK